MSESDERRSGRSGRRDGAPDPDATRMTIGEHLEELRRCLVRSLLALLLACVVCIWPAKFLLELIARPAILVLYRYNQTPSFLQTGPVEVILIYIKVVVIAGIVIAAPYIIHQLWSFVAAGLYPGEKKFVYRLVPWSVALFLCGVAFMYTLVLLVSLKFLVGFSQWLPLPNPQPRAWERVFLGAPAAQVPASQPGLAEPPAVPILAEDPPDPPLGHVWFNVGDRRLKVRGPDDTYSIQLLRDAQRSLVTTHFKIGDYLTFVLIMMVGFGVAFQMPLVVYFLGVSGIVPVEALRRYRKFVILIIVFTAGILAPPDMVSHLMLSGPMILLFELGLLLAARKVKARPAA